MSSSKNPRINATVPIRELSPGQKAEVRRKVEAFYAAHCPSKLEIPGHLDHVAEMSVTFSVVWTRLHDKYAVAHNPDEDFIFHPERVSFGDEPTATSNADSADDEQDSGVAIDGSVPMCDLPVVQWEAAKKKLRRFCLKHDPAKIANPHYFDNVLQSKLSFPAMWTALHVQYGVEEEATLNTAKQSYRERLVRFYEKYCPDKLETVDLALERYAGKEEKMFEVLAEKYGPETPANRDDAAVETPATSSSSDTSDDDEGDAGGNVTIDESIPICDLPDDQKREAMRRVKAFYKSYAPANLEDRSKMKRVLTFRVSFEMIWAKLHSKYNVPLPGSEAESPIAEENLDRALDPAQELTRERLIRFFDKYAPEKSDRCSIDKVLERFRGDEERMFTILVHKYGPEPSGEGDHAGGEVTSIIDSMPMCELSLAQRTAIRRKLSSIYAEHAPEKLNDPMHIDRTIEKYNTETFATLLEAVQSKYGISRKDDEYTARLTRFYTKYNPEKAGKANVDSVLQRYEGREEYMFEILVMKYGPEPTGEGTGGVPSIPENDKKVSNLKGTEKTMLRSRLTRFYARHFDDIDEIESRVDRIFTKPYTVGELIRRLEAKYMDEVPKEEAGTEEVDASDDDGEEEDFDEGVPLRTLSGGQKRHAERRLRAFYQQHCPADVHKAERALVMDISFREVMRNLHKKYDVRIHAQESSSAPGLVTAALDMHPDANGKPNICDLPDSAKEQLRPQFVVFYSRHIQNPEICKQRAGNALQVPQPVAEVQRLLRWKYHDDDLHLKYEEESENPLDR